MTINPLDVWLEFWLQACPDMSVSYDNESYLLHNPGNTIVYHMDITIQIPSYPCGRRLMMYSLWSRSTTDAQHMITIKPGLTGGRLFSEFRNGPLPIHPITNLRTPRSSTDGTFPVSTSQRFRTKLDTSTTRHRHSILIPQTCSLYIDFLWIHDHPDLRAATTVIPTHLTHVDVWSLTHVNVWLMHTLQSPPHHSWPMWTCAINPLLTSREQLFSKFPNGQLPIHPSQTCELLEDHHPPSGHFRFRPCNIDFLWIHDDLDLRAAATAIWTNLTHQRSMHNIPSQSIHYLPAWR